MVALHKITKRRISLIFSPPKRVAEGRAKSESKFGKLVVKDEDE